MTDPSASPGSLSDWLSALRSDSSVFPHQLDAVNRRLLLVRIPPGQIRDAAFLDQRVLTGREPGAWVPLGDALAHAPTGGPQGTILHCGHAGSTLVSRLLGELPGTRVLREPLILHTLAAEARSADTPHARLTPREFDRTLALARGAFAKTADVRERAIVKQTSLTANVPVAPAVLCLWIPLADYLATMLRDPGLREGVRLAAGQWIQDLSREPDLPSLGELEDAELAALNWVAAQLAFARARAGGERRALGWRFDDFLADPATHLARLAAHLGLDVSGRDVDQALGSHWMRRYAKDPRYPFDAAARRRELDDAARRLAPEIDRGRRFARTLW